LVFVGMSLILAAMIYASGFLNTTPHAIAMLLDVA